MDDLEKWRPEFPILSRSVYLISNSLGAMPRKTADSLADYATSWATRGVRAWEDRWWEMAQEVGDRIGGMIGAPPGSVSMHENVTTAQMVVLSTLPVPVGPRAATRRKIVCLEMDFPSLIYLYRAHADLGFELEIVPGEPDYSVAIDRLLAAIDDRTALVALSHVLFRSSYIMDPEPVVRRAHQVGALVVLDAYQSAGIIPLDVSALGVDFAVGGCLKWLCGGPGNSFLYTRPILRSQVRPRYTGWLANRNPFAFDIDALDRRDDAMGMMNGTPAIPAYYAAIPGLEIVQEVGVDRIRAKSKKMTARLLDLVDCHGFTTVASRDPERLAGTVAVQVPDGMAVSRVLKERDFLVDYRPGVGIRISPHFYNTFDEIDAIMAEIQRIVSGKEYAARSPGRSLVT
ncbi:MAG: aminotransferase class V-fold PLP-dependent enzyme [Acidobacteria bacterium]|nr:aminotransferase class V-fold PLP-dependent enzyme [Acidobacteriota bacterium]MBI3264527.1 aminotransferase class V-fold PLP-dependent enzyme [Acidobacteriota bacterium]